MKHIRISSLAAVVALTFAPVIARAQAAPAPTPPVAVGNVDKPVECGKTTIKRHDHGAERGGGSTAGSTQVNKACPPDATASGSKSTTKKPQRHDHTKTKTL